MLGQRRRRWANIGRASRVCWELSQFISSVSDFNLFKYIFYTQIFPKGENNLKPAMNKMVTKCAPNVTKFVKNTK